MLDCDFLPRRLIVRFGHAFQDQNLSAASGLKSANTPDLSRGSTVNKSWDPCFEVEQRVSTM
jgi:hypothetical protein